MERITIDTGLDGFLMVDEILGIDDTTIYTRKNFSNRDSRVFSPLESLAQSGAMHVRYITGFKKHAFLLKINNYDLLTETAAGPHKIFGKLESSSNAAYSYDLCAEKDGTVVFRGKFLFATVDYDESFERDAIEKHYQKVFLCLTQNLKQD